MRNTLWVLTLIGAALLAVVVLLPVLGVIFLLVAIVLVLGVGALLAAPLLAKLPWFRDRITVDQDGTRKTIRFGGGMFTSYRGGPDGPFRNPNGQLDRNNVIDVEGKEIPDDE